MNKNFFKIDRRISLLDILKILNISKNDFYFQNRNLEDPLEKIFIKDLVSFQKLNKNNLSFCNNIKSSYKEITSGICIVSKQNVKFLNKNIIKIPFEQPKKGFEKILKNYFSPHQKLNKETLIHPSAIIHSTVKLGKNVFIGAFSIIDEGVVIEDNVYISERVSISFNCKIGRDSFIGSGVFIECTTIDKKVSIYHNTVLGKIGFGFIPKKTKTSIMPHIGGLEIGEGTCVGSGCTIDRGLIENTKIGKYVMIDNQVHIGHNCLIDDFCILAGQVGLSGSVVLKKNVFLGGDVSIRDNVTIGHNSIIAGASKVFNDFPDGSKIGGSPAQDINSWKRLVASQRLFLKKRKKN